MHPRTHIRATIAARLKAERAPGQPWTLAGPRVCTSRARPIDERTELPLILIYTPDEKIDADSYPPAGADGLVKRTLDVLVEAVVRALDDVDDVLDTLAGQIEAALEWLDIPDLATAPLRLMSTEIDVATEGRLPLGGVRLAYEVTYYAPWRPEPAAEGTPPAEVWLGQAPRIGPAHRDEYEKIAP